MLENKDELYELLIYLTNHMDNVIAVVDRSSTELLFGNESMKILREKTPGLFRGMFEKLVEHQDRTAGLWEVMIRDEMRGAKHYFKVESFPVKWKNQEASAHILTDITEMKKRNKEMERLVYFDPVSGLHNRRYCLEYMQELLEEESGFCICFIDLDQLKFVNDRFGHCEGDHYIRTAARILCDVFRKEDVICRLGGDEYVVILEDCPKQLAVSRMEFIRRRLMEESRDYEYPMNLSYGVVAVSTPLGAEEILDAADKKMYEYKKEHRKPVEMR